jgi:hypothetical protein
LFFVFFLCVRYLSDGECVGVFCVFIVNIIINDMEPVETPLMELIVLLMVSSPFLILASKAFERVLLLVVTRVFLVVA